MSTKTVFLTLVLLLGLSIWQLSLFQPRTVSAQKESTDSPAQCDDPAFAEFYTLQPDVTSIWHSFQTETNTLEKVRLVAGLIIRLTEDSVQQNIYTAKLSTDPIVLRETACRLYLTFQKEMPLQYADQDANSKLQSWFVNRFAEDIGYDPLNPNVISAIFSGNYYKQAKDFNQLLAETTPYNPSSHSKLARYFASLPPTILRNRQLTALATVFAPDELDTSATGKLKTLLLNRLKLHADERPQLSGCALLDPYVATNWELIGLLTADANPSRLEAMKQTLTTINLSCLQTPFVSPFSQTLERWQDYLRFLAEHDAIFTTPPSLEKVLEEFNIDLATIHDRRVYGSNESPLISREQIWAVIAIETFERVEGYTFPPSRGHQLYGHTVLEDHLNPMNYVVYATPPTSVNWVPNMLDYRNEQPNKETYIEYLLAHEDMMQQQIETGPYNLPLPRFTYSIFMITDRDFLKELSDDLAGQITNFHTYALPDISRTEVHNWKVQTTGPSIPGSRQGTLSAEDTWRGTCGSSPRSNPYQYTWNGITYCLDVGGIHERGHLAYGMGDLYHYNTTDFFWNYDPQSAIARQRCELFQNLQSLSPYTMTTTIADPTLSTMSYATLFTPLDWEYMHQASFPTRFHLPLSYDLTHMVRFRVEMPESDARSEDQRSVTQEYKLEIQLLQNNPTTLISLGGSTAHGGDQYVEVAVPLAKLNAHNYQQLLVQATSDASGSSDLILFPKYMIEHVVFMHQRAGLTNQDYVIPIHFDAASRPLGSSLGSIDCSTPAGIAAAANLYYNNRLALVGGITSDPQAAQAQLHPYATVSLPLNMHYFFVNHNRHEPPPVFPSDWSGPMPSL